MDGLNYDPLIKAMTWSYSRVDAYECCPYGWYLRYIRGCKDKDQFYATYGKFIHKLLEDFYNGSISKEEMLLSFLRDFHKEVRGRRPKESTVQKYINAGASYLSSFTPLPYRVLGIEKRVEFRISGLNFIGYIDYLGEDESGIVIVDNKSRDLKPRSKRSKPTLKDKELDDVLRQLYLYAAAIKQEYGKFPSYLCLNCFKSETFIKERFDEKAYGDALTWARDTVKKIRADEEFLPDPAMFKCNWICGVSDYCKYRDQG